MERLNPCHSRKFLPVGILEDGDFTVDTAKTYALPQATTASRAKCLNGKDFALLHLRLIIVLDEWNHLASMDFIVEDVMGADASNGFDGVRLPVDLDLVALHGLLDLGTDIADTNVDSSCLY